MAENEFEKNVRKEMDEFKLHPSEEVWPKIEERIRERNRKRRILFFVLFPLIALLIGYGVYSFSGSNTTPGAQHELSQDHKPDDKNKTDNSKNLKLNKETIAIKPTIPVENAKQTAKTFIAGREKQVSRRNRSAYLITPASTANNISQNQTTDKVNERGKKEKDKVTDKLTDNTSQPTAGISSPNQQQVVTDNKQKEIANPENKSFVAGDTIASSLKEPNDSKTVKIVNKKKGEVSNKISWGIYFSAGSSVITEDAFSLKSSNASADVQYSAPGSSTGGGPATGGGGTNNQGSYFRYGQSQNEPAFAFKAGISARKTISKRSSLTLGLGYSYLADKIKIGTNQAPSQSSLAMFYYSGAPQETHTDHFHFIELPLSYNWRVTNNADHFLSLNAGIAPSYLVSTNALVYDTSMTGIYYYNRDAVTKAHLNFISGLAYQFKSKNNLQFVVGPQFSFDVTKVFKSDLDQRKYFLYTGIEAKLLFEKKKK